MVTLQLIAAYLPSILQMRQHKRHLAEIVWNCSLKVEWEVRRRLLLVLGGLLPGGVLQKLGVDLVLRELYVSARGIWSNYELWNVYDIINSLNSLGRQVLWTRFCIFFWKVLLACLGSMAAAVQLNDLWSSQKSYYKTFFTNQHPRLQETVYLRLAVVSHVVYQNCPFYFTDFQKVPLLQRFLRTILAPHLTTDPLMKQFLTESMCGYFSGSVTETSVSLMLRYWSTEWRVPQMERSFFSSTTTSLPTRDLKNE